jgi:hypothetical protein
MDKQCQFCEDYQQRITELEADKARLREAFNPLINWPDFSDEEMAVAEKAYAATSSRGRR